MKDVFFSGVVLVVKNTRYIKEQLIVLSACFIFSSSNLALAQQQSSITASKLQPQQGKAVLEEVIVTAQKRETTLQETPIAVTALTGEELSLSLINNALDIQLSIPNMLMSKGQFNSSNIAIRGIGNTAVGSAADSGTGVHFNGVYLAASQIFETDYFDVERVEVLRGPQGTLYGRNTTAGVINLIPVQPGDEFGGDIQVDYGNYNSVKLKGAVNIPLSDSWSQRFAGYYHRRDGFVDNVYKNEDVDDRNMYSLRSSTMWQDDNTQATLLVNYFHEDSNRMRYNNSRCLRDPDGIIGCMPTALSDQETNSAATIAGFITRLASVTTGLEFPEDDFLNSVNYKNNRKQQLDFTPAYQVEEWIGSFELIHNFEDLTLTSLTGYYSNDYDARNDYDLTVASELWPVKVLVQQGPDGYYLADRLYSTDRSYVKGHQWSQELRLSSNYSGDWNFLLGAFWLDYQTMADYYVYSSSMEIYGRSIGLPELQRQFWSNTDPYELNSWAVFSEVYWQATDRLKVTVGLRYTEEEKKSRQRTVYLNLLADPFDDDNGYDNFQGNWDEVTGRFNLSYEYSDDVLLFGTLSRSYKSGGFNPIAAESPLLDPALGGNPDFAYFEPEYINALELGIKAQMLDNRMQANVAWFYYDFENLQASKITNQTAINENVDSSAIQGAEAELIWVPNLHWRFNSSLAWLNTEIDKFESVDPANINKLGTTENIVNGPIANVYVGPDCPGGTSTCDGLPYDLSGNELSNSPEYSINIGVAYTWFLPTGMELTAGTSYYWQDSFYTRIFNSPNDKVDSWTIWNASLRLESADKTWFANVWIRNIEDEDSVTGQALGDQNVGLGTNQFLLEPRTYGLTIGYYF